MKQFIFGTLALALIYLAYDAYGYRYYLKKIHIDTKQEMVLGQPDSNVKVVAYVDYSSSASRRLYGLLLSLISTNQNVSVIIRPVETDNKISKLATRIALAAKEQGKFVEVNNFFLTNSIDLDEKYIKGIMRTLNLQYNRLESEMYSDQVNNEVMTYKSEAKLLGVSALPYVFVNHVRLGNNTYSLNNFTNIIDDIKAGRR